MAERSAAADEWETLDDDGFIYKRRKRAAALPSTASLLNGRNQALSEQAELRVRAAADRRKKITVLLAQKQRYTAELADWDSLLQEREEAVACDVPPGTPGDQNSQEELQGIEDTMPADDLEELELKVQHYERHIQRIQRLPALAEKLRKQFEKGVDYDKLCLQKEMLAKSTPRNVLHSLHGSTDETGKSMVSDNPLNSPWDRFLKANGDLGKLGPP